MTTNVQTTLQELREYKRELKAKRKRKREAGAPNLDLAHLDGKISGLDAGIAALEEL